MLTYLRGRLKVLTAVPLGHKTDPQAKRSGPLAWSILSLWAKIRPESSFAHLFGMRGLRQTGEAGGSKVPFGTVQTERVMW
jgi:hypothetical protein